MCVFHRAPAGQRPAERLRALYALLGGALWHAPNAAGDAPQPPKEESAMSLALFPHDLLVLVLAVGTSAMLSTVIHAYMPTLRRSAGRVGDGAARAAVTVITEALPRNVVFRAAVNYELRTLASQADELDTTVSSAASRILAKLAPQFPMSTRNDVVEVIGDFTHAFAAGLAAAPLPAAAGTLEVAVVAAVVEPPPPA